MTKKMEEAKNLMLQGFNCSQSVSAVFAEAYGQDKANILRIASGFGGGMRQAEVCGAVSGAIMVIGFKYGIDETNMQDKGLCYEKTLEFMNHFKEKNNSMKKLIILLNQSQYFIDYPLLKPDICLKHSYNPVIF